MQRSPDSTLHLWTTRLFGYVEPPVMVLIVDDDPATADGLAQALAAAELQTAMVYSGAAVFRVTQNWTPHIVILDIQMPHCDGFQVARGLRSSPRFTLVPIIAHTSLAEQEVIERGKAAQIDAFCRKGNSPRRLLRLIEHLAPAGLPKAPKF